MLQSMWLGRVGHDLATVQRQQRHLSEAREGLIPAPWFLREGDHSGSGLLGGERKFQILGVRSIRVCAQWEEAGPWVLALICWVSLSGERDPSEPLSLFCKAEESQ